MRAIVMTACLLVLSFGVVLAQTPAQPPFASVSPATGDLTAPHQLQAINLPPSTPAVVALFDPSGEQTIMQSQTDSSGSLSLPLQPPAGGWQVGLYRAAVGWSDGQSVSSTFVASDGHPHLFAEPALPSPTSALNFVGTGLPPNRQIALVLHLTGGQDGAHTLFANTDANGSFSIFVWPQQFGFPFFAAGDYLVEAPDLGLSAPFMLREHPGSSSISVEGPVVGGSFATVHFRYYRPGRYVWGVVADMEGRPTGEFLVGATNAAGSADASLPVTSLPAGEYLIATPYDWGETSFDLLAPTPTDTPTPLPTATRTPRPTIKATVAPRHRHRHHHRRRRRPHKP